MNFEDRIKVAKEKESYISYELYCILRNAVNKGLIYEGSKCQFKEVIPEYRIGEDRADLVVFATKYTRPIEPFLVIELKVRAFNRPGPSMANAVRKAKLYASRLNTTIPTLYAIYNGWDFMAFSNISPYLIGVYASIKDENQAGDFLLGLEEFSYSNRRGLLNKLPKSVDPDNLFKRVMPSIAKEMTKDVSEVEHLLKSWSRMLY